MLGQSDYAVVDLSSGAVIMPDNSVVMPDGSVVQTDGSVTPPPSSGETIMVPTNPQSSGGSWVSVLQNVSGAVASVLKNMTGVQSVPAGYHINPLTGQLVSNTTGAPYSSSFLSSMPSWLLPVGLGIAAFVMLKKK